jgi:vancomycin resistance protein YoaR
VRADSPLFASSVRRRDGGRSALWMLALGAGVFLVIVLLVGLAYAGSSTRLAEGTQVAGVDIGGMTKETATGTLQEEYANVADKPVTFVAGESSFSFAASQLGVEPDWRGAVAAAASSGDGFGPLRGFRRLHTRFFGAEVQPSLAVSNAALDYALDRIASRVDQAPRNAALVRSGLRFRVVPEESGMRLSRDAAAELVVRSLGSIERPGGSVALPVSVAEPRVTAQMLAVPAQRAKLAVSRPVFLRSDSRSWRLSRARIATLLELPRNGARRLAIAGPKADAYFHTLAERVGHPPVDAGFEASGEVVGVTPARPGVELDVPKTAAALLRAATSPTNRVARVTVVTAQPDRSTAEAQAMGIDRLMGSYKTYNAGTWDRITNLRLGVTLLDGTLVPPGGTFSLNGTIGERTEERGFRSAPVIIGTEYEEEVGGGTSQVATTVFNAAWEAGVRITERNPHSLYISRYQLGRDATVYWPSLDLKFQNDTSKWILVKGYVEGDGIRVSLYGGERRRVESSSGTLEVTGRPPVERVADPTLPRGQTLVEAEGSSPSRTSVTRTIYGANGDLMRTETWNTAYKGETRIVHYGTKPKEKPKPPPATTPKGSKPGDEALPPADGATTPPAPQP